MLNHDTWVQSGTRMGFRLDFRLEGFSLSRTGTVPSLWRHRLIKTLPCRKQRITCRPTYHYGGISFTFQDVASKIRCCAMLDPKEISLLGRGATGTLYRLNDFIAVKVSREGSDEMADHANEQSLFKKLEDSSQYLFLFDVITRHREAHSWSSHQTEVSRCCSIATRNAPSKVHKFFRSHKLSASGTFIAG